jgi:signal transduction histidine kinase
MVIKKILEQFNLPAQAKKYGIPLWQYPQFLFLVMGIIIIGTMIFTYTIGSRYVQDPFLVSLIVIILTFILFIIAFIINQSFEKLAEASRMKSELIGIASHQLRTPLTGLKWAADLLLSGRMGHFEEKQLEFLKILKDNSDRMAELIGNLLTASKIEDGANNKIKKEKTVPQELLSEAIRAFTPVAKAKKIEIKSEIAEDLPEILSDPAQLKMVFENLLDNAIRYSNNVGEIKVWFGEKKGRLCFEIKDQGVGIPKEDQKYIFQKFFRSKNAMHHQTQGTGLGLYIIKSIVTKLGGKIGFQSEENKGSTFWFTLPIK